MSYKNKLYYFIKTVLIKIKLLEISRNIKRFLKYSISYLKYRTIAILFKNNFNKQANKLIKIIGSQIIYINPEIITASIIGKGAPKPRTNFIFNGDWDIDEEILQGESGNTKIKISEASISIQELFVYRIPYQESTEYKFFLRKLEKYGFSRRYKNLESLNNYFKNLIKIYEDIRDNGYKTQKHLKRKKSVLISAKGQDDEIVVFIGRNGNLIGGNGGRHRMAIVKLLGINEVPVLIVGVHYLWARKCFEKYKTDVLSAINKGLSEIEWIKGFD